MFIRRVQTRPRAGSQPAYASFRLVHSIRSGNSVRQLTLLNLGAHFAVPRPQWPVLCELIESIRSGRQFLLEPDPDLLRCAQQIAERLSLSALPDSACDDLSPRSTSTRWTTASCAPWEPSGSPCRPCANCASPTPQWH